MPHDSSSRLAPELRRLVPGRGALVLVLWCAGFVAGARGAAVDWRLLGDWAGGGQYAGVVMTFSPDGGYVIAQDGAPIGFGTYAVDGRQMLLFPGGGELPERGAYGFSGSERLFIMTQNFGRSEWQRMTMGSGFDASRDFEFGEQSADDKSSFEKAVEQLEKLSESLDSVEKKLDGKSGAKAETTGDSGKKRSLFERMKDAAKKTAASAGNLSRKAARSVKAAGDAWKKDDGEDGDSAAGDAEEATIAEEAPPATGINPMLGGPAPASNSPPATGGMSGGLTGGLAPMSAPGTPTMGNAPGAVPVDVSLAQRAAVVAARWKPDAQLLEIVAHVAPNGSADVSTPPQTVSLWFASSSSPGDAVMMTLAPDGSFVTAPVARTNLGPLAPASFVPAGQAIGAARGAGAQGDSYRAALRAVTGGQGSGFAWIVSPVGGGREVRIDAVSGQPLP